MDGQTTAAFWLSPQQKHIYSLSAGVGAYRTVCMAEFGAHLGPETVRNALREVISRHDILRTVFQRQPGMKIPFQIVLDDGDPAWEAVDISNSQEPDEEIERFWNRELQRDFDLNQGPLVSATLIKRSETVSTLLLSLPALCADRQTVRLLLEEISKSCSGGASPDEALRYVQFAQWANDLLESDEEAAREAKKFWAAHAQLVDPALTALAPSDPNLPFSPQSLSRNVPNLVHAQMRSLSQNQGARPADLLLAAWQTLAWRLTSVPAFRVGVVLDGREYDELKPVTGVVARRVPIAARFDGECKFGELAQRANESVRSAAESQEYYNPVEGSECSIAFEFTQQPSFPELPLLRMREYSCTERFTLKLVAVEGASGITLEFHYDSSRLSAETVAQLAGYFETLLAAAVEHPETRVSRLPLLNQRERRRVLDEWNQTAAPCPQVCLHELFEQQVERTPERPALRCGERVLSYRELNQAANQLAHHLRRQGVGPDSLVGLCVERSAEMIVALLGILKAGGAYVPLNPDNPKPRLAQQLKGVVALISEQAFEAQLPEFSGHLILLDGPQPAWKNEPASNPEITTTPENLVYVIYTSGSTGVPKGVAVRHRNLVNYTHFIGRLLKLEQEDAGLQFATVSTLAADLGNTCIYPALVSGGCLHVIPYEVGTDAQRLARYTAQFPIDVLKIVPSHLAALLDSSQARQVLPRRYLITGGETLTRTLVEKISSLSTDCELINHYGPTETTVGSLTLRLKDYDSQTSEAIPIGRPIANTQVYILDAYQQPVPVGVVGELYIAGAGITAGYLNQAETTAERFLTNPFVNEPGARMYRTGDLARYRPDGTVEFLGRSDDQVKIRGFRIELGEIEAVLAQHAAVKQAVVLARAEGGGEKRLVAYVVARQEQAGVGEELKKHVGQQLPDYMVPAAIVLLSKLPLTANGKIDRQALPAPEQVAAKSYVAPRTEVEQQVAAIWAEVLKRDRISVDDNFFELGGHSLLATQVISRVREQFEVELAIRAMFDAPSISGLSQAIEAEKSNGVKEATMIKPVAREAYRAKLS